MIRLSCNHVIEKYSKDVYEVFIMDWYPDYDEDRIKESIRYMTVCKTCYEKYEQWGILLKTEQEKQDWLGGKIEYPKGDE